MRSWLHETLWNGMVKQSVNSTRSIPQQTQAAIISSTVPLYAGLSITQTV